MRYQITYSIASDQHARTKNSQYVTIKGSEGETEEQQCEADFDVVNQDVLCVFHSSVDIGDYRCVSLRTGGNDGIDLSMVSHSMRFDCIDLLNASLSAFIIGRNDINIKNDYD